MARTARVDKRVRAQYELSPEVRGVIENLRASLGADSDREVVRRAVIQTAQLLAAQKQGWALVLRSPDGKEKEVLFL